MLLGVDRLDYTKGIDVRLQAFAELLDDGRLDAGDTVLVQVATPSRERVEHYAEMRDDDRADASGAINGELRPDRPARRCTTCTSRVPARGAVALYLARRRHARDALRDGMNLVAKEYVASRADDGGALVLSEFTGAADELADGATWSTRTTSTAVGDAIVAAATQDPEEARRRMGRCARRCSSTTSSAGRRASSRRWAWAPDGS